MADTCSDTSPTGWQCRWGRSFAVSRQESSGDCSSLRLHPGEAGNAGCRSQPWVRCSKRQPARACGRDGGRLPGRILLICWVRTGCGPQNRAQPRPKTCRATDATAILPNIFNPLGKFRVPAPRPLQNPPRPFKRGPPGEMAEWLKAHAWKACVRETVPWVRIPLSPPSAQNFLRHTTLWARPCWSDPAASLPGRASAWENEGLNQERSRPRGAVLIVAPPSGASPPA